MSRPLRSSSDVSGGYTRLERTVMEALVADLRDTVPDLARQFSSSRLTVRRNSGFGLFTEMAVSPALVHGGPSGDFGTVHVSFLNLRDPVAFTVRLQDGRLVGLMGDSYGQDTRQIDFASAPVDQVFTVDASGRSVPSGAQPAVRTPPPRAVTSQSAPRPVQIHGHVGALQKVQDTDRSIYTTAELIEREAMRRENAMALDRHRARPAPPAPDRYARPADPSDAPEPVDDMTLLIGAWAVLAVGVALVALFTDIPWIGLMIGAFWIGAALRKPRALAGLRRFVEGWNAARSGSAAWNAATDR